MAGTYDVRLGRIALPTVLSDLAEAVGSPIDTSGGGYAPTAGQQRITLTLPVHVDAGDPEVWGHRMRRQLRSLLNNPRAAMQVYLQAVPDPQLGMWLALGECNLAYGEGAPGFAEYTLQVGEAYKLGTAVTHRSARLCRTWPRWDASVPRDYLKRVYATSSDPAVVPRHFFPAGATDFLTGTRAPASGSVAGVPYIDGLADGEGVSYELAVASLVGASDVVVYDTRGAADAGGDPQVTSGWEEVYGPDWPLTGNLVVRNGTVSVGPADMPFTVHSQAVVEWTLDRAVVAYYGTGRRAYVTLQRGWGGAQREIYGYGSSGPTLPGYGGTIDSLAAAGWEVVAGQGSAMYWNDCRTEYALAAR